MPQSFLTNQENQKSINIILWLSIIINIVLIIAKFVVGYSTHIQSLILDGFHSMSDFLSDVLLLMALPFVYKSRDENHHYGHARYENILSMLIAIAIIAAAIPFISHAINSLIFATNEVVTLNFWAWLVTIFTIIVKEILYRVTVYVGEKTKSAMLIANGIHHRSDAFSSMLVLVALLGVYLGWEQADEWISILLGFYLLYAGVKILWESVHILSDKAPEEDKKLIESLISDIEEVFGFHDLNLRESGPFLMGDIHLELDGDLTIREADVIVKKVQLHLRSHLPQLRNFTIHLDEYKQQ